MARRKPIILITNDDGIDAPGIRAMWKELRSDYETLVVAPKHEKSGAGCSLSLSNEMEVDERKEGGKRWGLAVDGTPADCVKFAITAVEGFKPDLVLSGINRGMNVGNSVFYSGTVAAALEGSLFGIPAMACSSACLFDSDYHFEDAAKVVAEIVPWLLKQPPRPRTLWNLNIPNKKFKDLGKLRLTTHGTSFYVDQFELYRQEGDRQFYRNMGSKIQACAVHEDSDDKVVKAGDISLTLLGTDLTTHVPEDASDLIDSWNQPKGKSSKAG